MKLTTLRSRVIPLLVDHIDTDQIIPARFLKTVGRTGLGEHLFAEWKKDPSFVLHRPEHAGSKILLSGQNFGCGSSREHAPWALVSWGIRAVIAGSFADIFKSNALRNGLLPVAPSPEDYARIVDEVKRHPDGELEVDLEARQVRWSTGEASFFVDEFARDCLLRGIDPLDYLVEALPAIQAFEARHGF